MAVQLDGAVVVVTGGGAGIGAAMVRRFAREGARVAVNDLDTAAAQAVAKEAGALAVPGDAADDDAVRDLVSAVRSELGEIDLFCANAGVAHPGGPEVPDETWRRSFDVNVLSHVHAVRHLLPGWLDRGRGHYLATVSAAGLLTMLGAAPYAVSKHAALAFVEWVGATYGDRGVTVQALCPQGVRTPMLAGSGPFAEALLGPTAIDAEQVAEAVVESLADPRFLVLPHPEVAAYYAARAADPDGWLAGMQRLRHRIEQPVRDDG
jgi:NAD(P)-dependent dehydrogenase (short-subunit alcohol dehydrogenase family)